MLMVRFLIYINDKPKIDDQFIFVIRLGQPTHMPLTIYIHKTVAQTFTRRVIIFYNNSVYDQIIKINY